ncbi:MAG: ATPase, T2SS/T4P/T4SS family, partial [Cyanobacteriota bacterium]
METKSQTTAAPSAEPLNQHALFADLDLGTSGQTLVGQDVIEDLEAAPSEETASPILALVNRILVEAVKAGASDIHVEPEQEGMLVRFRQDGVLRAMDRLPKNLVPAVTSRFKIMADLDIAERRLPQDGRIRRKFRNQIVDFRVSTLPGRYGEKVVLRLLDSSATKLGLDTLITDLHARAKVRDMGGSDLHLAAHQPPYGRFNGQLRPMSEDIVLTEDQCNKLIFSLLNNS